MTRSTTVVALSGAARPITRHLIVLSCLAPGAAAWAQATSPEGTPTLPPASVTGCAEPVQKSALSSDPAANPASVTVLELTDDRRRNTRDYVDLLKPVMGVAANNFDQGGIGFGFTMRADFRNAATAAASPIRSTTCRSTCRATRSPTATATSRR